MAADHIVRAFDQELAELRSGVMDMGEIAQKMLKGSLKALLKQDVKGAQKVIESDEELNRLHQEMEEKSISLIARRQPMAMDLREIIAAMRIATDVERIGDLAKNISIRLRTTLETGVPHQDLTVPALETLGDRVMEYVDDAFDCFEEKDTEGAILIWKSDETIDALYNSLFRELLTYMMQDPRNIGICTHLLFSAKDLERIADHASSIAETVYFVATGHTIAAGLTKAS